MTAVLIMRVVIMMVVRTMLEHRLKGVVTDAVFVVNVVVEMKDINGHLSTERMLVMKVMRLMV